MGKPVVFTNKSNQKLYIEIGQKNNLIGKRPEEFQNAFDGFAELVLFDTYGLFYIQHEEKPLMYFRHTDLAANKYRFGNILELGDGPLSVQKGPVIPAQSANGGAYVTEFRKISDDPPTMGFDSAVPSVEYRLRKDALYVKEGDAFFMKAEPWPITIYDHQSVYLNSSVVYQPSTFSGVINGKPFMGLGSYDRFCMRQNAGSFSDIPLGYTCFCLNGIRDDGRKEMVFVSGSYTDGKTAAIYYLEGEVPIVSDSFEMEADWYHLPYVDDGTCIFKNATIRFCGKEFHFEGKWGTKGFLDKPRIEKHGQSHAIGTWYEGKTPKQYRLCTAWSENMDVYDHKLKALGFDVVD